MNLEFFSPLNELSRNICFAHSAHSWKSIRANAGGWRTRRAICESLKRDGRLQQHQNHDASTCKISLRGALHADANWILIFRREFNSSWGRSAVPGRAWEMNRMDQDSVQLNKRFSERKKIISSTCIIQLKILSSCANVCRSPTFLCNQFVLLRCRFIFTIFPMIFLCIRTMILCNWDYRWRLKRSFRDLLKSLLKPLIDSLLRVVPTRQSYDNNEWLNGKSFPSPFRASIGWWKFGVGR